MDKIWFKYKISIMIVVYGAVVFLGAYFLVIPLIDSIKLRAYEVQAKAIDREIERTQINKLPEVKKEWTDYESRQDVLTVVLSQADQVSFIENIEAIAQASGNKIDLKIEDPNKNSPSVVKNKGILSKVAYPDFFPIQINLEGNYSGLVNFMHMLENSKYYVNVVSLTSVKNSSDNSGNQNPFANSSSLNNPGGSEQIVNDSIKTNITAIVYTQKK